MSNKLLNVLIIGSGGREHALAFKIKQSSRVDKLYCAPGNAGIQEIAECVDIKSDEIERLIGFVKERSIDFTIVGPEAPLVLGIVDRFEKENLKIFGPRQCAAQLEGSKVFAKDFMNRRNIPTAFYQTFADLNEAHRFLNKTQFPLVVKADGLAAGKGVIICQSFEEAEEALNKIMKQKIFKEAGTKVVIEEYLKGEEVTILALSDGENYTILESAQDHKRIFDDDLGPNTGGMGAYSPNVIVTAELLKKIEMRIIEPTIRGMRQEGCSFKGILYAGLMMTLDGPKVLEFNVRFGDPEAQAILPRLKNDLLEVLWASFEGRLSEIRLEWDTRCCVCVVMSSSGYPDKFEIGKEITGLDSAARLEDTFVFHAGTRKENNRILSNGGRVLGVTSLASSIEQAVEKAYTAVEKIKFDHCFFRRDIGAKAIKRSRGKSRIKSLI